MGETKPIIMINAYNSVTKRVCIQLNGLKEKCVLDRLSLLYYETKAMMQKIKKIKGGECI